MFKIKNLSDDSITSDILLNFAHNQIIKRKYVNINNNWEICKHALKIGADKLFISAIPSVETAAFYFNMGCIDAKEIIVDYIDTENDRYFEYLLI